jgi:hypothetical protein
MLTLPRNLSRLARLAPKDNPRYAVHCLKVYDPGDETYRVEVTDGRVAAVVRGICPESPPEQPEGTLGEALIPAADWARGFALGGKDEKDRPVGLALGRPSVFSTGSAESRCMPGEGRFPTIDEVFPKRPPLAAFDVDPRLLAALLDVAVGMGCSRVTVCFYHRDKPVGLAARSELGQFFDGMIMPLGRP